MTLTTRVYVHDQISRSEVMDYCNRLLEAPKDVATRDEEMWLAEDGRRVMGNLPCQGLDGLLKVYYRANAFYEEEDRYEHDGEERWLSSPKCWIQVSIDSPYGYRGENGESCGGRLLVSSSTWAGGSTSRGSGGRGRTSTPVRSGRVRTGISV